MNNMIGSKIKQLRTGQNLTLKDLSESTGLSIGFLSQLERGLTTVATDSLDKIARRLGVELAYFFVKPQGKGNIVLRSYEKQVHDVVNDGYINYYLSNKLDDKIMLPRMIDILPNSSDEEVCTYAHKGEEYVYVLEGILTLFIDNSRYELYPGDCAHYSSEKNSHNWANYTNKMVKILVVSVPNPMNNQDEEEK